MTVDYQQKTKALIDGLKSVCANYGLGNDGNEYKIIVQMFQYKLMNDKFISELRKNHPELEKVDKVYDVLKDYSEADYEMLLIPLDPDTTQLRSEHLLDHLANRQNEPEFAELVDDTLVDIASSNSEIFSVRTQGGTKIQLFDRVSRYINDESKRDAFCKGLINKLVDFSFEHIFNEKFDFYATIFEYLIKDYNKDGGGKYAEYYTPHAVAKIMAACLVTEPGTNKKCYDPSAGTGQLLMNLAHAIGEHSCSIFSQDISQKSSSMLRLNLILNNLVHSIPNIVEGNTILSPYGGKEWPDTFDYIVSNPPFKLDFSEYRDSLDTKANHERFFAGIPNVPNKKKDSMAIYLLFIQQIVHKLNDTGKAAIVVPSGFITAKTGIDFRIRKKLVDERWLAGVINMPSNIFATTTTNVSILFIDKKSNEEVVLIDASNLGTKVKVDDKNQKTLLNVDEEDRIISAFNSRSKEDGFSVAVGYDKLKDKKYSFNPGLYFEVKLNYEEITKEEFDFKLEKFENVLSDSFKKSRVLEAQLKEAMKNLKHG